MTQKKRRDASRTRSSLAATGKYRRATLTSYRLDASPAGQRSRAPLRPKSPLQPKPSAAMALRPTSPRRNAAERQRDERRAQKQSLHDAPTGGRSLPSGQDHDPPPQLRLTLRPPAANQDRRRREHPALRRRGARTGVRACRHDALRARAGADAGI